jgi:hypothetical protein
MADVSNQDFAELLSHIKDLTGSMNKLVKNSDAELKYTKDVASKHGEGSFKGARKDAGDVSKAFTALGNGVVRFAKHLESNTINVSGSFKKLSTATEGASGFFSKTAATFVAAGAMIGVAVEENIKRTFQTYQGMRNIGQTFGGSLLQLQLSAAQARLPLDKFAELLKNNGQAAASLGAQGLGQWSRGLRESLKDVGELGMSTDQLNDVVGNYTQTMMLFGRLQTTTNQQAIASMRDLSIEATALAGVSGKNRMELMKDANTALQSATLRSAAITQEGRNSQAVINATTKATMFLASLPGEAGSTLSKMLADTVGSNGAYMTEAVKDFTNAGLYGVANMMDTMADKVKSGKDLSPEDEAKFYRDFIAQGKANMATLNLQAQAGNQSAIKAIAMIKDMENQAGNFTADNIRKQREQAQMQTVATKAISNLQEIFNEVSGAIRERFLKTIIAWSETPAFKDLIENFKKLGGQVSELWSKYFTPENLQKIGNAIFWLGEKFISGISLAVDGFTKIVSVVNRMVDTFGRLGTAAMLLAAYFGTKFLAKRYAQAQTDSRQRVAMAAGVSQALARYSSGGALRVTSGGFGSNAIAEAEEELRETGLNASRGTRWRRVGYNAGQRVSRSLSAIRNFPSTAIDLARNAPGGLLRGAGTLAKGVGPSLLRGTMRYGGIASALGGVALDMAPNFRGKETLSNALSMGGLGAQIGSIFGPLGTLIGGGVGALAGIIMSNWEPIKNALGKAIDWIGSAVTKVFGWVATAFKFTPIGMAVSLFESLKNNGLTGTFDAIKEKFDGFFAGIGNMASSVGEWIANKFSWLKNFDVFGIMKKAILALPGGSLLVNAFEKAVGTTNVSGPTSITTPNTPNVEVDRLQNLVNTLQKQNADMQKQMHSQQQVMLKILEALQHGNAQDRAIAMAAQDSMKKLGMNMDPNKA